MYATSASAAYLSAASAAAVAAVAVGESSVTDIRDGHDLRGCFRSTTGSPSSSVQSSLRSRAICVSRAASWQLSTSSRVTWRRECLSTSASPIFDQRSIMSVSSLSSSAIAAAVGDMETDSNEEAATAEVTSRVVSGKCFVVDDNIDTDQIIPAEYLTLVPSKPDEYEKLGSYAMCGLPARYGKYMQEGKVKTEYPVMIGGANFGCGSSREHAPVAMGAAGCRAVVAQSFARIYFRNCVATGELYPVETDARVCEECTTGDEVTVDMKNDVLVNHTTGKQYSLKPIGEAGPVIDAGGIFSFARSTGMIAQRA